MPDPTPTQALRLYRRHSGDRGGHGCEYPRDAAEVVSAVRACLKAPDDETAAEALGKWTSGAAEWEDGQERAYRLRVARAMRADWKRRQGKAPDA